jgi:hypothetical protein
VLILDFPGPCRIRDELARLKAAFPGWLITADEQWGMFTARRPGLRLTHSTARHLEAEMRCWEMS